MKNQKIIDYELINKRMNEIHKMCDKILNDIEDHINPNDTKTNYLVNNMVANKINDSDSDSDNIDNIIMIIMIKKLILHKMIN